MKKSWQKKNISKYSQGTIYPSAVTFLFIPIGNLLVYTYQNIE